MKNPRTNDMRVSPEVNGRTGPSTGGIPYRLVRTRRRTMALVVTAEGSLEVRAPLRASVADIHRMIERHKGWIDRKRSERRQHKREEIRFEDGVLLPVCGIPHRLMFGSAGRSGVRLQEGGIVLAARFRDQRDACRKLLTTFYKKMALERMEPLVHDVAERAGLQVKSVRITSALRRWGSCSSRGSVNFSFRIAQAPDFVQRYLAVHEVAHLRHPNHSRQYWAFVARLMPDFHEAEVWLKKEGGRLPL